MTMYILNQVPTKVVQKTPFELFKGWKPSLRHILVWGCPSKVRIYNPQENKLDPRTISGHFIGYAKNSKCYKFYCSSHTTRIVESRNKKFLNNDLVGVINFMTTCLKEITIKVRPLIQVTDCLSYTPMR